MDDPCFWDLWQVQALHFTAGMLVAQDGEIVHTAPILAWARGKSLGFFRNYCAQKGWKLTRALAEAQDASATPTEDRPT